MELKIMKCMHCGNIIEVIDDHGVTPICCGEPMKLFKAGETDGAQEKHVPAVTVEGDIVRVNVGSVTHPMTEEHHIAFIWLVTDKGIRRASLDHTGAPGRRSVWRRTRSRSRLTNSATCTVCGRRTSEKPTKRAARERLSLYSPTICRVSQNFTSNFVKPT